MLRLADEEEAFRGLVEDSRVFAGEELELELEIDETFVVVVFAFVEDF
jgi:hypothetical protein